MVVASAPFFPGKFFMDLDEILLQISEDLQLSPGKYDEAVARYTAVGKLLESSQSPFRQFRPYIYPQGSMALGTTVQPILGPHDLDFVLELSVEHVSADPMRLIKALYDFFRGHGVYGPMTSLKNRCVRIEYENDFYLDVLPACLNSAAGDTCVKVPDCTLSGWTDSNPRGYIKWFEGRSRILQVGRMFDSADPIPPQEAVGEKETLQIIVQLLKRWRDWHYAGVDRKLAPISIVLTTLAADLYRGERSVSQALTSVLGGIRARIEDHRRRGQHLAVFNPSNRSENPSERWDSIQGSYEAFEEGIRDFHQRWVQLVMQNKNTYAELGMLFGEPVKVVLRKRAQRVQESRLAGGLGVTSSGVITSSTAAAVRTRANTFYGTEQE